MFQPIDPISSSWPTRMRRKQASQYLFAEPGVSLSPGSLGKLAATGGGPSFRKDGRYPLYERASLDSFAVTRLGPLRRTASDRQ